MIVINFKNYKTGKEAVKLARLIGRYLPRAVVCPSVLDIGEIAKKTGLRVFAQHVSCFHKGRATGFVIPEFVKKDGARGTMLNHSEHRISEEAIKKTVKEVRKAGLKVILCVANLREARRYKKLKPWAMAFEDRKLVGSGKSITKYKSKDVSRFVDMLKGSGIIPLCGAGVSTAEDVTAARELGCGGVLIASAIAKARKPERLLRELGKQRGPD